MLMPDNINPKFCLYFNGGLIIKELKQNNHQKFIDLYIKVKNENDISITVFILCLDWLYTIDAVEKNEGGEIILCL